MYRIDLQSSGKQMFINHTYWRTFRSKLGVLASCRGETHRTQNPQLTLCRFIINFVCTKVLFTNSSHLSPTPEKLAVNREQCYCSDCIYLQPYMLPKVLHQWHAFASFRNACATTHMYHWLWHLCSWQIQLIYHFHTFQLEHNSI